MKVERSRTAERYINFTEAFRDVSRGLAGAYSVPEDFYAQSASIARLENGISINNAKAFLNHVHYDQDKAAGIVNEFVKSRKLADIGVNIGSEVFLRVGPDSEVNGRSLTIAALAQRAARLESLLTPNGIPEAYATAHTQTRQALSLVERAARLAYDWSPSWGKLSVDNALSQARGTITRQKVAQASMVGVLALAGCNGITISLGTPEATTGQGPTPTTSEIVPAMTETLVPTPTATIEPTQVLTPTITATVEPTQTETPTITPTETIAPTPEGPTEFSEKYPPEWSERYVAHVGGMEIPISLGLTRWVRNRPEYPISEIHIAPDMIDNYGDYFMHMCFWRYTQFMNHPDVSYDQYLQVVANGQGQVEIAAYDDTRTNQPFPEVSLIDPREGFSFVYADQALDIKDYYNSFYYGTSAGRLLMVFSLNSTNVQQEIYTRCGYSVSVCNAMFAQNGIINKLSDLGATENRCLLFGDVGKTCTILSLPPEFRPYYTSNGLYQALVDFSQSRRATPPTWVVEP